MTWLVPKLTEQVQILIPTQKPNDEGTFDQVYGEGFGSGFEFGAFDNLTPVLTIWMGIEPITWQGAGSQYVRGEQIEEKKTHRFICRRIAVAALGSAFSSGFDLGFDSIPDLNPLKGHYYLMVERGAAYKGRLFRIRTVTDVKERREYLKIDAEEIEEWGTGHA